MFTLHFPFYLLQRNTPVPACTLLFGQLLVDFYHHRLVLPIFGLHRNGKIHSMQLFVTEFLLNNVFRDGSPMLL